MCSQEQMGISSYNLLHGQDLSMRPKRPIFCSFAETAASFLLVGIVQGAVPLQLKIFGHPDINKFCLERNFAIMDKDTKNYVINLLETYATRERKIAVLHFELDHFSGVLKDEVIEAMNLSRGDGAGRSGGHISDKTLYIALNYQSQVEKMNADAKEEIVKQLVELEQEKKRLDYYISLLDERQAKILRVLYEEKLSQGEVEKVMNLSAKTIRKLKNEALDALVAIYEFVADLS